MDNPRLDRLHAFPFRRLAALLDGLEPRPGRPVLDMSIGEPRHPPPPLLAETVAAHAGSWNRYPPPGGTAEFRACCCRWLERRNGLPEGTLDPDRHLLPLAGTKEGLYLLAQLVAPTTADGRPARILMPDPLYAVYYGAAVMAGAEPRPLPATAESGFLPDLDALRPELLARTALVYLCSPSNPQGAVADAAYLRRLAARAREFDFILAVDECYAEIYDREPPPGALGATREDDPGFTNLLVFHSLSKRSNAPGLRSGFVAGDPRLLRRFLHLRAYAAAVQPLPLMAAAVALWEDETHVVENRALYRRKFDLAGTALGDRFGFYRPAGGFFLWLDVGDGEAAARRLWTEAALKVLPGSFLSATEGPESPGHRYIRLAMVHDEATIADALERLIGVAEQRDLRP